MIALSAPNAREKLRTLLSLLGANVLLALLLTTVMAAVTDLNDVENLSVLFVANIVVANCVTLSFQLGFGLTVNAAYAQKLQAPLKAAIWLVVFLGCVALGVELALFILRRLLPELTRTFSREAVLMVSFPVSLAMMRFGFLRRQREAAQKQQKAVENQLAEARLEALSARTHPHFLFNSLNSIAALVEDDPKAGEAAILSLARMFRYVLEGSRSTFVRLADELEFVQSYLGMEALRFGKRLTFSLDIDAELRQARVPPLLLQPLVENAVRHGMQARGTGRVQVSAACTEQALVLRVDDDGPGPESSAHRGAGTSHQTLRARLALLFGERAGFSTGASPLGGFRAEVRIPWGPR
jgi:sensor histidine kinase YesM